MTNERLENLIAAYGADPEAWPLLEREAGRAALARRSNKDLAEDVHLDRLLEQLPPVTPPDDLVARLMPLPDKPTRSAWGQIKRVIFPNAQTWPASVALASLCVGIVAGYAVAPQISEPDVSEALLIAAFETDPLLASLDEDIQ